MESDYLPLTDAPPPPPLSPPPRYNICHCYYDRKFCLKDCKKCISRKSLCEPINWPRKFRLNKMYVTCCDYDSFEHDMVVWKKSEKPTYSLCINYCNAKFEECFC